MTKLFDKQLEDCKTYEELEDWYQDNGGYLVTSEHATAFKRVMKRMEQIGYDRGRRGGGQNNKT